MPQQPDPAILDSQPAASHAGVMQGFPPPAEQRVTLCNWDRPPYNRWAFQNMRSLVPTARVTRGLGPVAPLSANLQDLSDLSFKAVNERDLTLEAFFAESHSDAVLVLHDGKIVLERYFGPMTESSVHLSQSVSKSLVGTLAGILIARGLVDPQAPVSEYVPELDRSGYCEALVSHLLDMTSGVAFSEDYGGRDADVTRIEAAAGWRPQPPGRAGESIYDFVLTLTQDRPHGDSFSYRSVETVVLAWVLERASGLGLPDLFGQEIWSKLGAEQDASYTVDRAGAAAADGGFNASLRDYGRFAQMHLDEGAFNGQQIVPAAWVRASRRGEPALFGAPYTVDLPGGAYAKQWWIAGQESGIYLALGIFGQILYLDPANRIAAVLLSSWPTPLHAAFKQNSLRAFAALTARLTDRGTRD
ncbi:MAG: serine hydrolase [Rhodospirillales bacterium]